jgi:hypothetical protein
MDAITPEYSLDPTGSGSFTWSEWQIDDAHDLAFHQPTRAVFHVYPAADSADLATLSIFQIRARLAHVCDGFPVPPDLPALAAAAIIAFAYKTLQFLPVELRHYHPAFAAHRFRATELPAADDEPSTCDPHRTIFDVRQLELKL